MLSDEIVTERRAFAETLRAVGPGAATLIGGWTAHDVAGHVLSLDRFGGVPTFLGRLIVARGWRLNDAAGRFAERGLAGTKRKGFAWALDRLRQDPPRLLLREPVAVVGLFEVFVHHEDVRRQNAPPDKRGAPAGIAEAIPWLLRYHRRLLSHGVQLVVRTPAAEWTRGEGRTAMLEGPAEEVVLWLAGRRRASSAELSGAAADEFQQRRLRI